MKSYIGIDNGVSGTIAILTTSDQNLFGKTPVIKVQDYTKAKKLISRLDVGAMYELLERFKGTPCLAVLERPMINPARYTASISAARCHEAMLVVLEVLGIPYQFIDSREWQKAMLPKGCEGPELKKASLDVGNRLFPFAKGTKHPDRDALLIAEYARRFNL